MKLALSVLLLVAIFLTVSVYAGTKRNKVKKRYRVSGSFRPSDIRRAKSKSKNQKRLLGPNARNAFLRRIKVRKSPSSQTNSASSNRGSRPKIRFVRKHRSQVNGNMGPNPVSPGRVPPSQVISPRPSNPPDASMSEPPPENLAQLSNDERNEVALDFFVRANYVDESLGSSGSALGTKKDMILLMQRNYGIPLTGELDDQTVSYMMAARCGYPDPPANYQTFPNNEHWTKNPVTYIFKGYTPDLSPCQVRNELKRALRVWEEVIELDFVETKNEDNADIIIFFGYQEHGDGYPFDEKNGLLAHAFTAGTVPIAGDTHFDEAEYWKLETGKEKETFYGNSDGAPCVFPFIYENQEYTTCTTAGRSDGLEWCSTTANFDRDGKIGFCPQETLFTYGGNADGKPCSFPFVFQNQRYDSCTYEGRSDGYRWCATTPNFDDDSEWGFCPDRAHGTYGGNSDGASCSFPFTFNGNTYTDCTIIGRNDYLPWCSTTPDYDRDQKYGFCQTSGYSLFLVAAHEFGHAIGLDHSSEQSALMYPMYQNFQNFQLPEDDRRGALSLYAPRTSRLRPLKLEKCGGDIQLPGGGPEIDATPNDRSSTTPRSSTTTTTPIPTPPPLQNRICDNGITIDALLYFGREVFVFKGREFWRMYDVKGEKRGPYTISEQWPGLPNTIDAVYKRPEDDAIVFFKGFRHWVYDGFQLREGYPKKLTVLGFPSDGTIVVDAALNWLRSKNRKRTYFYVGNQFYRYNEEKNKMDKSYPKPMSQWNLLPENVNAAMEDPGQKRQSLFIKNNNVYTLHNYKVQVIDIMTVEVWLGCVERSARPAPIMSNLRDRKIP